MKDKATLRAQHKHTGVNRSAQRARVFAICCKFDGARDAACVLACSDHLLGVGHADAAWVISNLCGSVLVLHLPQLFDGFVVREGTFISFHHDHFCLCKELRLGCLVLSLVPVWPQPFADLFSHPVLGEQELVFLLTVRGDLPAHDVNFSGYFLIF
jgi:hypothetical protein